MEAHFKPFHIRTTSLTQCFVSFPILLPLSKLIMDGRGENYLDVEAAEWERACDKINNNKISDRINRKKGEKKRDENECTQFCRATDEKLINYALPFQSMLIALCERIPAARRIKLFLGLSRFSSSFISRRKCVTFINCASSWEARGNRARLRYGCCWLWGNVYFTCSCLPMLHMKFS